MNQNQVPASFTGEALCKELAKEISSIRPVKNNASVTIREAIPEFQGKSEFHKPMHTELQNAASVADFDKIMNIKNEMELLVEKYSYLKSTDLDTIKIINQEGESFILPEYTLIFKIVSLKGIEQGTVHLEVDPRNIPTTTCGDGCAINLKGARLLTETYGIHSPLSKCSGHLASGTIQRMCTSVNSIQADATSLYDNLKALLKHFAMSPKSTEFLNNALNALELNSVHMLNWMLVFRHLKY